MRVLLDILRLSILIWIVLVISVSVIRFLEAHIWVAVVGCVISLLGLVSESLVK